MLSADLRAGPDRCPDFYCFNGGTCTRHDDSLTCECNPNYQGDRCQYGKKCFVEEYQSLIALPSSCFCRIINRYS